MSRFCQVGDNFACCRVLGHSADGHLYGEVQSASPMPVAAGAASPRLGPEEVSIPEIEQTVFTFGGLEHDAAPQAAVTAVRAATRHKLFAPETDTAFPAFAGNN